MMRLPVDAVHVAQAAAELRRLADDAVELEGAVPDEAAQHGATAQGDADDGAAQPTLVDLCLQLVQKRVQREGDAAGLLRMIVAGDREAELHGDALGIADVEIRSAPDQEVGNGLEEGRNSSAPRTVAHDRRRVRHYSGCGR